MQVDLYDAFCLFDTECDGFIKQEFVETVRVWRVCARVAVVRTVCCVLCVLIFSPRSLLTLSASQIGLEKYPYLGVRPQTHKKDKTATPPPPLASAISQSLRARALTGVYMAGHRSGHI